MSDLNEITRQLVAAAIAETEAEERVSELLRAAPYRGGPSAEIHALIKERMACSQRRRLLVRQLAEAHVERN